MQQNTSSNGIEGGSLPVEIVSDILEISARSFGTQHARNVCLTSRSIYARCWPSLHRIIALRTAKQLQEFAGSIYELDVSRQEDEAQQRTRLERRQDAIQFLYLNNNRDVTAVKELIRDQRPEIWMLSIILAARNLEILHVEEFWSISYPWESQEEKPLLAYPLLLLTSHLATLHNSLGTSSESMWGPRMASLKKLKVTEHSNGDKDWVWQVPQPREITLSALAMLPTQLVSQRSPPANAFARLARLHLYYAKMDEALISNLLQIPHLTHLRLTRPFSENLANAVLQLLGGQKEQPKIECLVVEAGVYMDDQTMSRLTELQDNEVGRGRLLFIDNSMLHRESQKVPAPDAAGTVEASSTAQVINWVTSSEERGFDQFSKRAQGDEGAWAR